MISLTFGYTENNDDEQDWEANKSNPHCFVERFINEDSIIGACELGITQLKYVSGWRIRHIVFGNDGPAWKVYLNKASSKINVFHIVCLHDYVFGSWYP